MISIFRYVLVTEGTAGDVCLSFIYVFAPYCELRGDVLGHERSKELLESTSAY